MLLVAQVKIPSTLAHPRSLKTATFPASVLEKRQHLLTYFPISSHCTSAKEAQSHQLRLRRPAACPHLGHRAPSAHLGTTFLQYLQPVLANHLTANTATILSWNTRRNAPRWNRRVAAEGRIVSTWILTSPMKLQGSFKLASISLARHLSQVLALVSTI